MYIIKMQIYLIRHKASGKSYVGQTIWDFNTRYKAGNWIATTTNNHLRSAGKKYGKEAFDVSILWEGQCTRDELDTLESKFMNEYNVFHPNGYNQKGATCEGRHYVNYREYELIDSSGTIYHVANLSQWCKRLGLNYGAMLNMVSGRNVSSYGYALSTTPIEQILDPEESLELEHVATGEKVKFLRKDAIETSKKIGIKIGLLWSVLAKRVKISNGWKHPEIQLSEKRIKDEKRLYEGVTLLHENGEQVKVKDVVAFAAERGIKRGGLYAVIKGEAIHSQGWRLPTTVNISEENKKRRGLEIELLKWQTGERARIKNISEWCRKNGLNLNVMHTMIRGTISQYMGWTLPGRDLTNYKLPKRIVYIKIKHEDGRELEEKNPKQLVKLNPICCSQTLNDIVTGKCKNYIKGWKVLHVRYLADYYPEIHWE